MLVVSSASVFDPIASYLPLGTHEVLENYGAGAHDLRRPISALCLLVTVIGAGVVT